MKPQSFGSEFLSAAKQAPGIYFAPVVGAIKAIKAEFARLQNGGSSRAEKR